MRILLVQPRHESELGFYDFILLEPLGLELIGASLTGHETRLLDLEDLPRLEAIAADFAPRAAGVSCSFTVDTYAALDAARRLKAAGVPFVFVGGHHASLSPADFQDPAVDAVVLGEGERTVADLVECLAAGDDLRRVAGLALNRPEGQLTTPSRPQAARLDDLPAPDRSLSKPYRHRYHLALRQPLATLETARGCPYDCNFCSVWKFYGRRTRAKSPARVLAELADVAEEQVFLTDDNFLLDVERAEKIAALVRQAGIRKRFMFQARSDTLVRHPEVIDAWQAVGLEAVFIGFEKIDPAGMAAVNKRNSVENNERALRLLHARGVGVWASFIVDPDYAAPDFRRLREYVHRLRIRQPYFSVLTPLPGTELAQQLKDRITTANRELFDLLHAVVPTRLPLPEFYRELSRLYLSAYAQSGYAMSSLLRTGGLILSGRVRWSHLARFTRTVRHFTDPSLYLLAHGKR